MLLPRLLPRDLVFQCLHDSADHGRRYVPLAVDGRAEQAAVALQARGASRITLGEVAAESVLVGDPLCLVVPPGHVTPPAGLDATPLNARHGPEAAAARNTGDPGTTPS